MLHCIICIFIYVFRSWRSSGSFSRVSKKMAAMLGLHFLYVGKACCILAMFMNVCMGPGTQSSSIPTLLWIHCKEIVLYVGPEDPLYLKSRFFIFIFFLGGGGGGWFFLLKKFRQSFSEYWLFWCEVINKAFLHNIFLWSWRCVSTLWVMWNFS